LGWYADAPLDSDPVTTFGWLEQEPPGGGVVGPPLPVSSDSPYADRISFTGWKYVVPPEVQLPDPPEVTPCAWLPDSHEPPESPGSAQTLVRVRPVTVPCG
jgi:hypothetical protein